MKTNNQSRTKGILQIGDIVTRHPHISEHCESGRPVKSGRTGIVEYIHPLGRFHAVRFQVGECSYLECFKGNMVKETC